MDAQEYDRIADLLTQIANKIKNLQPERIPNVSKANMMYHYLLAALEINHKLAEDDARGWL